MLCWTSVDFSKVISLVSSINALVIEHHHHHHHTWTHNKIDNLVWRSKKRAANDFWFAIFIGEWNFGLQQARCTTFIIIHITGTSISIHPFSIGMAKTINSFFLMLVVFVCRIDKRNLISKRHKKISDG